MKLIKALEEKLPLKKDSTTSAASASSSGQGEARSPRVDTAQVVSPWTKVNHDDRDSPRPVGSPRVGGDAGMPGRQANQPTRVAGSQLRAQELEASTRESKSPDLGRKSSAKVDTKPVSPRPTGNKESKSPDLGRKSTVKVDAKSVSPRGDVQPERYDMLLDEELPPLAPDPPPLANIVVYKNYMLLRYEYQKRGLFEPDRGVVAKQPAASSPAAPPKPSALASAASKQRADFDPSFVKPRDPPPPIPSRPKGRSGTAIRRVQIGKFVEVQQDNAWKLAIVQQISGNHSKFKVVMCESDASAVFDLAQTRCLEKQPAFPLLSEVLAQSNTDKQYHKAKILKLALVKGEFMYLVIFSEQGTRQFTSEKQVRPCEFKRLTLMLGDLDNLNAELETMLPAREARLTMKKKVKERKPLPMKPVPPPAPKKLSDEENKERESEKFFLSPRDNGPDDGEQEEPQQQRQARRPENADFDPGASDEDDGGPAKASAGKSDDDHDDDDDDEMPPLPTPTDDEGSIIEPPSPSRDSMPPLPTPPSSRPASVLPDPHDKKRLPANSPGTVKPAAKSNGEDDPFALSEVDMSFGEDNPEVRKSTQEANQFLDHVVDASSRMSRSSSSQRQTPSLATRVTHHVPPKQSSVVTKKTQAQRDAAAVKSAKGPDCDNCGLFEATTKGDVRAVKKILDQGKVYVDYRRRLRDDNRGCSALHYAVSARHLEMVQLLVQHDADVNMRDARELSPLHKAVGENCDLQIVELLLDAGADVMAVAADGNNVLHMIRHVGAAQAILSGLSQDDRLNLLADGSATPLHVVAADLVCGNELCDLYLATDAADINGTDINDEPPVFYAARAGALRALAVLLENGCSLELLSSAELSVFQVCLRRFRDEALEMLMSGALLNESLVNSLIERQSDAQPLLEKEGRLSRSEGTNDDDDDAPDGASQPLFSSAYVNFQLAIFEDAFTSNNFTRQIVSLFRLGQEYILLPDYYYFSVMCWNAAKFLCLKHYTENPEGINLLAEAIELQIEVDLKKMRSRGERGDYPPFVMDPSDQFAEFQQRHFGFVGKLALFRPPAAGDQCSKMKREVRDAAKRGFPELVFDRIQFVFEDE